MIRNPSEHIYSNNDAEVLAARKHLIEALEAASAYETGVDRLQVEVHRKGDAAGAPERGQMRGKISSALIAVEDGDRNKLERLANDPDFPYAGNVRQYLTAYDGYRDGRADREKEDETLKVEEKKHGATPLRAYQLEFAGSFGERLVKLLRPILAREGISEREDFGVFLERGGARQFVDEVYGEGTYDSLEFPRRSFIYELKNAFYRNEFYVNNQTLEQVFRDYNMRRLRARVLSEIDGHGLPFEIFATADRGQGTESVGTQYGGPWYSDDPEASEHSRFEDDPVQTILGYSFKIKEKGAKDYKNPYIAEVVDKNGYLWLFTKDEHGYWHREPYDSYDAIFRALQRRLIPADVGAQVRRAGVDLTVPTVASGEQEPNSDGDEQVLA